MSKFIKLISELECTCLVPGKIKKNEFINFIKPSIDSLYQVLSDQIIEAQLKKPHYYRFYIQVHAQEKEK